MDTQLVFLAPVIPAPELEGWSVEAQTKSVFVSTQTPLTNSNAEARRWLPSSLAGIWHREFGGGDVWPHNPPSSRDQDCSHVHFWKLILPFFEQLQPP